MHLLDLPSDYRFRRQLSLGTIPDKKDIDQAQTNRQWRSDYELNDPTLFGRDGLPAGMCYDWDLVGRVRNHGLDVFLIAHRPERVQELLSYFPDSIIVRLVNFKNFWALAKSLKATPDLDPPITHHLLRNDQQEVYDSFKGPDWPQWQDFEDFGYDIVKLSRHIPVKSEIVEEIKEFYPWYQLDRPLWVFNVDQTIFHKQKFLDSMSKLYQWLDYEDFDHAMVENMWQKYSDFHGFQINTAGMV